MADGVQRSVTAAVRSGTVSELRHMIRRDLATGSRQFAPRLSSSIDRLTAHFARLSFARPSTAASVPIHRFSRIRFIPESRLNVSASDLALPASLFTKPDYTQVAVTAGQGPFSNYHQSYNGFEEGVAATFSFLPIATVFYQGSIFSDAASAQAYMGESATQTGSYDSSGPTDCSSTFGVPCQIASFPTSDGIALYSVAQVNYCTIEVGFEGDATLISQNSADLTKFAADIQVLGIDEAKQACTGSSPSSSAPQPVQAQPTPTPQAPQPTPTAQAQSATVSIIGGGLAHKVHGKLKVTKSLKSGESGIFVVLFREHGTSASTPSATMVIFKGHKRISGSISMREFTPTTGAAFFAVQRKFTAKYHPLHLTARITVSADASRSTGSIHFTVKPKPHKKH